MTRGKHATATASRRLADAQTRIAELERALEKAKLDAREREAAHQEELTARAYAAREQAIRHAQEFMIDGLEDAANKLSAATWMAQRVAMTEHLVWLFFKGYLTWDRFEGDREVLQFIATHGDLKAWWKGTDKYGHIKNHKDRRASSRRDPMENMLLVIEDIIRSKTDRRARESREALDAVVEYARDAFMNVELNEVATDSGWETIEPSEEQVAMHREIMETVPRFLRVAERV